MGAYGADGMSSALEERMQGITDLTTQQENEVERRLEDRAWDEAIDFAPAFSEWLFDHEDWRGGKVSECLRVMFAKVDPIEWRVRVQLQRSAVINDYIAYRVNTFTDDERAEVEREVMGEA